MTAAMGWTSRSECNQHGSAWYLEVVMPRHVRQQMHHEIMCAFFFQANDAPAIGPHLALPAHWLTNDNG